MHYHDHKSDDIVKIKKCIISVTCIIIVSSISRWDFTFLTVFIYFLTLLMLPQCTEDGYVVLWIFSFHVLLFRTHGSTRTFTGTGLRKASVMGLPRRGEDSGVSL